MKQMKILHGGGFSNDEKLEFKILILQNIFEYLQCLIHGMDLLQLNYSDDLDMELVEIVRSLDLNKLHQEQVDERHWIAAENIWRDFGIQICYQRRNEFPLGDNAD
jgi:guanine nucleotide-binding protein G(i) subunit alpha